VVKDAGGAVTELRCTYDPESRGGSTPDGRKVQGTLQWVSAAHAAKVEVRLYDNLFRVPFPEENGADFLDNLNPDSLEVITGALVEPALGQVGPGTRCQFMRHGYFFADPIDSRPGAPVFNRTATLKDSWAKLEAGGKSE